MLAYRHAFHAGNHADVLKHLVLVHLVEHLNQKDKGYRVVDTHAGAGAYALSGRHAQLHREFDSGIARLWALASGAKAELPAALRAYLDVVRTHNGDGALRHYPGSPEIVRLLLRAHDELRLFELHATDHGLLHTRMRGDARVAVQVGDGFAALKAQLPPPTRRGLVVIDPSYEIKSDYTRTLAAVREAITRFADGLVLVWIPQLALLEASRLPERLETAAAAAPKGWLRARLTVRAPGARGLGLAGSEVFVINPPHTLGPALRAALPVLAQQLGDDAAVAGWALAQREGTAPASRTESARPASHRPTARQSTHQPTRQPVHPLARPTAGPAAGPTAGPTTEPTPTRSPHTGSTPKPSPQPQASEQRAPRGAEGGVSPARPARPDATRARGRRPTPRSR